MRGQSINLVGKEIIDNGIQSGKVHIVLPANICHSDRSAGCGRKQDKGNQSGIEHVAIRLANANFQ